VQLVRRLVEERPTYGYRRITALANSKRAKAGASGQPNTSSALCARRRRLLWSLETSALLDGAACRGLARLTRSRM
jgi:hypothetical protein